jgi:hypothetical protein
VLVPVCSAWGEDLHDDDRLGKPILDFIDSKIIVLIDQEPFNSAYSLAEAIGVPHSMILRHLQDSLGMKSSHLR